MSDGDSAPDDDPSTTPDDLGDLDEVGTAQLAARIWGRFLGRRPDLRDERDEQ